MGETPERQELQKAFNFGKELGKKEAFQQVEIILSQVIKVTELYNKDRLEAVQECIQAVRKFQFEQKVS